MDFKGKIKAVLGSHGGVLEDLSRKDLTLHAIEHKEAVVAECGALATWTPPESTGRSPKDTMIVRRDGGASANIDWDAPNNIPLDPETFEMLWQDALGVLESKPRIYVTNRVIGADPAYALPVTTVTDRALTAAFTVNMFRAVPADIARSIYAEKGFTLFALPYDKIRSEKYQGRLRDVDGRPSDMAIVMDFDNRVGLVYGSAYCGSCKKLMFTVMNYMLPDDGILPLHCSANEGPEGDCALLLGLSGTGKTTLSADPSRALLGDDEHGWSDTGVANFENGCYAKLINLRKDKEPEIWDASFRKADPTEHGAIIENCMIFPNGRFDVDDDRLTPNSRVSYPLTSLSNIKADPVSGHPRTILFLAADANGVLPPVARLDRPQAMLWFLMGYTSKLAGTETGITTPRSTFSRFFGAPFMPRHPDHYADLLGKKMAQHGTDVYLVNTGWSGGPYGVGQRMDINLTRAIVDAALSGKLAEVDYEEDELFHLAIPKSCPGVPSELLFPRNTWPDGAAYDERARALAADFAQHFDKAYGHKNLDEAVVRACPGK
ncbi:MAG: phosphoenolpyruvate carboxykinase (ATP) [Acidobacteriota bacterium]|nr:phosphoenolpyruvate carboxykinase (ATP) [Acidobacteriota bacterium]MDQ7087407.1 phosphoenolpyruvate carboxykinase (ATP) [Acidobacteriota bacterium]